MRGGIRLEMEKYDYYRATSLSVRATPSRKGDTITHRQRSCDDGSRQWPPTSCASAADIVSVLFFAVMRYDPQNPRLPGANVFVLPKGHAAPLLYAAWAEAGAMPRERLLALRKIGSDLEGHPTPRLPFVDVATGSLGQGLSAGVGIAYDSAKLRPSSQRVYVLMGDGESAEGSIWEAAQWAALRGLGNLCATIDINRLGQSEPTILQHDLGTYQRRWEAFG
jgi:transketolase